MTARRALLLGFVGGAGALLLGFAAGVLGAALRARSVWRSFR